MRLSVLMIREGMKAEFGPVKDLTRGFDCHRNVSVKHRTHSLYPQPKFLLSLKTVPWGLISPRELRCVKILINGLIYSPSLIPLLTKPTLFQFWKQTDKQCDMDLLH